LPVEIKNSDSGRGNIITGCGALTGKDLLDALRAHLTLDPEIFSKYRYSLADYSEVSEIAVSSAEIEELAALCQEAARVNPDPLVATVASKDIT